MTLLNKLKAICPHCHHHFLRFKVEKGIRFCPHCELSLLAQAKSHDINPAHNVKSKVIISFLVFMLTYAISIWKNEPWMKEFESTFIAIFVITILTGLFFGIFHDVYLRHRMTCLSKIQKGVDTLETVMNDIGNYKITGKGDVIHATMQCPTCTSQRLQRLYEFKTNLSKRSIPFRNPNILHFIGCLHCYTQYSLNIEKTSSTYMYAIYFLTLFFLVIANTLEWTTEFIAYWHLSEMQGFLLSSLGFGLYTYTAISVFSSQYRYQYKDNLTAIDSVNTGSIKSEFY